MILQYTSYTKEKCIIICSKINLYFQPVWNIDIVLAGLFTIYLHYVMVITFDLVSNLSAMNSLTVFQNSLLDTEHLPLKYYIMLSLHNFIHVMIILTSVILLPFMWAPVSFYYLPFSMRYVHRWRVKSTFGRTNMHHHHHTSETWHGIVASSADCVHSSTRLVVMIIKGLIFIIY